MSADVEPFHRKGSRFGVLFVHGFTGTPFELSYQAEKLHHEGPTVRVMRLPGHGTSPRDLDETSSADWQRAVRTEYEDLARECDAVAIVGQSLGGLLALDLAGKKPPKLSAVVSLAAPLWLNPLPTTIILLARTYPRLRHWVRDLPKFGSDVRDREMKRRNPSYNVIPVKSLLSFSSFMESVALSLGDVVAPLLIVHGRQDHTAPFECAKSIAESVGSEEVRTIALEKSYHLIGFDVERTVVAKEIHSLLASRSEWPGAG